MIKTVIIDDDEVTHKVIKNYIERLDDVEVIGSFYDGVEAISFLNEKEVDLLFLDVEMPEMTGFSFLDAVRFKGSVIIVSSEQTYALKAFGYNVLDFLHKPILIERFYQAINRFKDQKIERSQEVSTMNDIIFVRVNRQLRRIDCKDIISITANGDYLKILLRNDERLHVYGTLINFQKIITDFLVRIHRKHIVNISEIQEITDSGCHIKGVYYPIGRTYIQELKSKLNIF
ncbi:MAG: LytTR family DNA-binding domain-containing protein [Flavobacteriales bacterium]|jgi:DNA-binding LytR/AlgR family response regulator|nr:LytTR family DNA-binding domain-containing protein [Flavobacteriales bacterium]